MGMKKNKAPLILTINCNAASGGGRIMLTLAQFARKNGFDVITVAPESVRKCDISNHIIVTKRWQKALNWRISKFVGDDLFIPFSQTNYLIKYIEENKPSLVHLHGLHGYYIDYIRLLEYLNKAQIPIVWTQHDCWAFTGKCPHYTGIKCKKWQTHCEKCPQLNQYPSSMIFDRTGKMFERKKECFSNLTNCTFIPVSRWLEKEMSKSFLPKKRLVLIENGIDTSTFKPCHSNIKEKNGIQGKRVVLGVASSWSERKGIEDFFILNSLLDKSQTVVVIIGTNQALAERCKNSGIIAIPRTANVNELVEWYTACDVFFNPSIEETFGLVTAEAMACGAPVIGYHATATTEILEGTPNFCVESHDMQAVLNAMDYIFSRPKIEYSTINRQKIQSCYDINKQFAKYIELYRELLNQYNEETI